MKYKFVLFFIFFVYIGYSQNKLLKEINSYNLIGDFQKSYQLIKKYQDKNNDTLNCDYLICLADYYCINNSIDFNPLTAFNIIKEINCEKLSFESFGLFFNNNQNCISFLKEKKDKYASLQFELINKSNNIDSLKLFTQNFTNYIDLINRIQQKIISIEFNVAKESNSKEELFNFINKYPENHLIEEAKTIIELVDYKNSVNINTIESYLSYIKLYPNSNKINLIQSKLDSLSWEKCLQVNTTDCYLAFINNYPKSFRITEAKLALSKLSNSFDLSKINSFTTISESKNTFEPFRIINGRIEKLKLNFLSISNNGKIGLAIENNLDTRPNSINRKKAFLINLTDGFIFFEFECENLSSYFFNSEDSKLFFYENPFLKQLDIVTLEIINLFEIKTTGYSINNFLLNDNIIHICQDQKETNQKKYLHYTYNLNNAVKNSELLNSLNNSETIDVIKDFNIIQGNSLEKLLMLKLIYGDNILIKQNTKSTELQYIILNFPNLYILENGKIKFWKTIEIFKTDLITKELKKINFDKVNGKIQFTDNLKLLFSLNKSIYILKLENELSNLVNSNNLQFIDPFEIKLNNSDKFNFAFLDENSNKLFYQVDIGYGCDYNDDFEIYVHNLKNKLLLKNQITIEDKIIHQLEDIDEYLFNFYSSYINQQSIKNQPLETDSEKYLRIKDINNKINPSFIEKQDSLFNFINKIIKDSIKIVNYEASKIFSSQNYIQTDEAWKLDFKNPFNGKDFSLIFPNSKLEARSHLLNEFVNLKVDVKYYFNLISLSFEPLYVHIKDNKTNITKTFFIPFKDKSLIKNLYLTNNSYFENYSHSNNIDCKLERGDITYDFNILKYFVNNGKPKYFFNYGFMDQAKIKKNGVNIQNIIDSNVFYIFQDKYIGCCPTLSELNRSYTADFATAEYLRLNDVPYFIDKSIASDNTSVYEMNKSKPIFTNSNVEYVGKYNEKNSFLIKSNIKKDNLKRIISANLEIEQLVSKNKIKTFDLLDQLNLENIDWDASFSPNGKFLAIRCNNKTTIYNTSNWNEFVVFENTEGKLYWDCNSYFLGIGNSLIPILLLDN